MDQQEGAYCPLGKLHRSKFLNHPIQGSDGKWDTLKYHTSPLRVAGCVRNFETSVRNISDRQGAPFVWRGSSGCTTSVGQTRTNNQISARTIRKAPTDESHTTNFPNLSPSTLPSTPLTNDDHALRPTWAFPSRLRPLLQNPLPLAQTRLHLVRELGRVQKGGIEIRRLAYVYPPPFIFCHPPCK